MRSSRFLATVSMLALLPMCESASSDVPFAEGDAGAPRDASTGATMGSEGGVVAAPDGSTTSDSPDAAPHADAGPDTLDVSFAFTGCNRLQKADWDPQSNPSSANLSQLRQTFADVSALATPPKLFFFTGDLVLGLNSDTTLLEGQLDAWAHLFASDPSGIAKKTALVPLVGNHEMLQKVASASGAKTELQATAADGVWTSWLGANKLDARAGNGPTNAPPNADALEDDQSKLTYSFDEGDVHYVVLNTDTWTSTSDAASGSTQIGWIALHWLEADLAAAQANAKTRHIFLLGHKPIVSPVPTPAPEDAINSTFTVSLESLLTQTGKVRGYLCAHAHQWDARKLPGAGSHDVYQIIAGNGGSQLETAWSPSFYGFTVARVYASGRVGITSYQRPVPTPYTGAARTAVPQPEMTIAP